ncbi:reverse transcriptase [Trichonephila clavipes]|nr:reverse transcriptase [Trichonephila clavipes]
MARQLDQHCFRILEREGLVPQFSNLVGKHALHFPVETTLPFKRLDLINISSNKAEARPDELKSCTLETMEQRYPVNERLHFYNDGSYLPNGATTGWFCRLTITSCWPQFPTQVVFFKDLQDAILALNSNKPTDCLKTIQCRNKIAELIAYGWAVALQWIPSNVEIPGNERAGLKVTQGAESSELEVLLNLRRSKIILTTYIDVTQKIKSFGKSGETCHCGSSLEALGERADTVARFNTGHDILGVYPTCLAWLLTRPDRSAAIPEWMATTCLDALDSMDT